MTSREFYAIPRESDYALRLELLQSQLGGGLEDLDKALEFTAIHAFLLGLRTGAGLARHSSAMSFEARTSEAGAPLSCR